MEVHMARKAPHDIPIPPEVELHRLAPLHEAARLAGCSIRFLRDHHRDKIIVVGPRMHRMRVRHALNIAGSSKQPAAKAYETQPMR
jgi:hypothetical protein